MNTEIRTVYDKAIVQALGKYKKSKINFNWIVEIGFDQLNSDSDISKIHISFFQ